MKAKLVGPNTNHTPSVKEDDAEGNRVEHGLGSQAEALLDVPKGVDSNSLDSNVISGNETEKKPPGRKPAYLRGNADYEKVRQLKSVVCDDAILQSRNDRDCSVQGVAKQEIACFVITPCQ